MSQNQAQNLKFKVKQFQWFEMETKVRQIIQEVLGALQKRILESSSTINKLKLDQATSQQKIQQITLMIQNDPKVFETGIFASVDRRFEQQQKKIQQLSRQIDEENKYVDQKFKILDIRMQESSQVLQNVASLRQRVSKQIQIQNQNINTVRTNIEQMISDLNADIRQTRKQQQDNLESCEKADYALSQRIEKNTEDIKQMKQILQNHKDLHRDEAIKLEHIFENLKKHTQEIDGLQQSKALTKKLQYYVKDLENQLKKVQFKLQAVSPLITQAQISQCLQNVLPPKMRKRIAIHEHKKYFKLNREVLQKQYKEVQNKFKGLQLLQEMQKKNTKQIVLLKRKKLQSMGVDVDNLTYEQRQKYYNELVLQQTVNDDDEQVKVTAKADQKQIMNIVNKHFSDIVSNIKQKVSIQLQDSKKYLYGIEQQLKHEISTFDNKLTTLKQSLTLIQSDQLLQNKSINEQLKQIHLKFMNNQQQFHNIIENQKSFYNFCSLVNHLEIQDQIDKQNISLMGVSQNNSELENGQGRIRNSIVQLDKKCFSCCGFPASTLSAFKMACLAYNPSAITIDAREYRREELLGITTNLLQKIKKSFSSNNKTLNISQQNNNQSPIDIISDLNEQDQKLQFSNQDLKGRINESENDGLNKKANSGIKFRKTKKLVGNSTSKYYHKSIGKQSTALKEDLMTATLLFSQLKKRNMTFLN